MHRDRTPVHQDAPYAVGVALGPDLRREERDKEWAIVSVVADLRFCGECGAEGFVSRGVHFQCTLRPVVEVGGRSLSCCCYGCRIALCGFRDGKRWLDEEDRASGAANSGFCCMD